MCTEIKNESMASRSKERGDYIPSLSEFINLDDGEGVIIGTGGNIKDIRVGVVCGGYNIECDKITIQILAKQALPNALLNIDQYELKEDFVVVSKSNILKNVVLLYAKELDVGNGFTGLEKYGGLPVFENIDDIKVVVLPNEVEGKVILDPRFLLPSHFRIVNKVTVLNGALRAALSKNWDHTAIGMYRIRSQLIRRMYSDIRSTCRGTKSCHGSFDCSQYFLHYLMANLIEDCGGEVTEVSRSSYKKVDFSITSNDICLDATFTSRSIFIKVPEKNMHAVTRFFGKGIEIQYRPRTENKKYKEAPFNRVFGDLLFEVCFSVGASFSYHFSIEFNDSDNGSGKVDNKAWILPLTDVKLGRYMYYKEVSVLDDTSGGRNLDVALFEILRLEKSKLKSDDRRYVVLANLSLISPDTLRNARQSEDTFMNSELTERKIILYVPYELFGDLYEKAKPIYGLTVNTSLSELVPPFLDSAIEGDVVLRYWCSQIRIKRNMCSGIGISLMSEI